MPSDIIKLNLVNASADCNNSSIVLFQRNMVSSIQEIAVAWLVIDNLGIGWSHEFTYDYTLQVSAADSWGNRVPAKSSANGQLWKVVRDCSGDQLQLAGDASVPTEVQIQNGLTLGAISANIYRSGTLLATKTGVAPGQMAAFKFNPNICIGVVSQVEQGAILDSAILSTVNTTLALTGLASADIVMSGGGPGRNSAPFTFTLQNKVFMS